MKKKGLFIVLLLVLSFSLSSLEITKLTEVTPHLQLVRFEDPIAYIQIDDETSSKAVRNLSPFAINRFETTYGLWHDCITQSKELGYIIEDNGRGGTHGQNGNKVDSSNLYLPVANVSWYDAVVWLNAYSELQGRIPCYTYEGEVLKDSREIQKLDNCVCDFSVNGFRLPSEAEWEYASRIGENGLQWGNLASGQTSEEINPLDYAWTYKNANTTNIVGTTGSSIGKKGSGKANGAGLYDMSGNVMELCWDYYAPYDSSLPTGPESGDKRVYRGGSWSSHSMNINCDYRYAYPPKIIFPYAGFRIACTITD